MPADADPTLDAAPPLEGELQLRLLRHGGRVSACSVRSTRPDVAARLLQGRQAETVAVAVPRLYTLCRDSQGVACRLALHAATGAQPDATLLAQGQQLVAQEAWRETALQVLLTWPRALGLAPEPKALAAARAARDGAFGHATVAEQIAQAVFGESAAQWLQRSEPMAWWQWANAGRTAAARHVASGGGAQAVEPEGVALLPPIPTADQLRALARDAEAEGFASAPLWQARPAETGALARRQHHPLVAALLRQGARTAARQAARLQELALGLGGDDATDANTDITPRAGSLTFDDGSTAPLGLGWAQNARGLLLHLVRLEGERAQLYRIVAPTEWNFHPEGALPAALLGTEAPDADALRQRARSVVDSLDPCVTCRVEVLDA